MSASKIIELLNSTYPCPVAGCSGTASADFVPEGEISVLHYVCSDCGATWRTDGTPRKASHE